MNINNCEFNIICKELKRLTDTYKQSTDDKVRNVVKEMVLYDISNKVDGFYDTFCEAFEKCKMDSLLSIDILTEYIINNIHVEKLPQLDFAIGKKLLKKLPDKDIKKIINDYNETAKTENISFFTHRDNNVFVVIYFENGNFYTRIAKIVEGNKHKLSSSYCNICNDFVEDVGNITIETKTKNGQYASKMIACCLDNKKINLNITNLQSFKNFFEFKVKNNEKNRDSDREIR